MMEHTNKMLLKGNEAVVLGALLAGCDCFFGYPITPASEIAHTAAKYFPKLGRVFLQAESEIAAINMVMGASAAGRRVLTGSSGLGISLKQEGVSYIACSELPAVIIDITRGGPGLGNIGPEQSDYNQVVKGGGHGSYRCIVLAPSSAQEMCDYCVEAFDLADKYRTPVYVMADGVVGQMMESVELPEPVEKKPVPEWALDSINPRTNMFTSIFLEHDDLESVNIKLQEKYATIKANEQRAEEYMLEDAEIIFVGYGIAGRMARSAVDEMRAQGIKAGLLRPISLFPFPETFFRKYQEQAKLFLSVEMSNGQMIEDIKLSIECCKPVKLINRMGGNIPSVEEIIEKGNNFLKEVETSTASK
jgi:2-oxoisovalerate ferredoxin oxidoreductase alpha subunit